ncbi:3'-5' exonuclease [Pseudomonas aeruginosa]|uniref:3'-5' exonuclease n=1 Tax=Pseudomonas aeruginosa TaxID=287 RepID=UPI001E3F76EA|nr:3'-5' exonuclease [Pseudomonas aeruginosa]MCC9289424.1 ATP-dependent helicase [Pseudomonas aeruginosa]
MNFTHEQGPAIISLARIVKLVAFARTGKSTTLVGYAKARRQCRLLHLCYNKSVEIAAKQKFPPNVTCKTAHGLAYASIASKYRLKLTSILRLTDNARIIGSQNWEFVRSVHETLNNYLASADDDIVLCDCPVNKLKTERMKRAARSIVDGARQLRLQMCDILNEAANITHDAYLKLRALSKPYLRHRYDIALGDDAQDINPVIAGVHAQQPAYGMAVVVCGEGHQMLFRFRGAVDALNASWLDNAEVHYLTESFRYGSADAHVANMVLAFKRESRELAGLAGETRVTKALPAELEHRTVLCRTMVGVIETALAKVETGAKIYWVGGIEGYNLQDLVDLQALSKGWRDRVKGKNLLQEYRDYDLYKQIADESQEPEMNRSNKIIEQYSAVLPEMFAKLRRNAVTDELVATITHSTAHRSKGLQWDAEQLAEDFTIDPFNPEIEKDPWIDEMNLLYVACTGAMRVLAVNSTLLEIMNEFVDRRHGRKPITPMVYRKKQVAAA